MDIKSIVRDLCAYDDEQEWFEFKENWFQPVRIILECAETTVENNIAYLRKNG